MDKINDEDLSDVSGGYTGIDIEAENKYLKIVEKAKAAYIKGKHIPKVLGKQDWKDLNEFYEKAHKSKKLFNDELQNMMEGQASGLDWSQYDKQWF